MKQDGLRVWLDEWEIQPGDMIGLKIQQGLRTLAHAAHGHVASLFRLGMVNARASYAPVPRSDQCLTPVHSVTYRKLQIASRHYTVYLH